MTTDWKRLVAPSRTGVIVGTAGLTVGAAFATVYLVGPITLEQSALLNVALGLLVISATVATIGVAVFLGLSRVRISRGVPAGSAGPGLLICLIACGVTMVLAVIGMAMRVGSPIETAGEAIFTTHGGEVSGVHERIHVPLPSGWRFRYGRQAWREGTLIDERGRSVVSLAVSIAPSNIFGNSLRSFAAERERGAANQQSGVKGRFRDGPRGLQWVIDMPGPSSPRGTQIAEEWGPEVLYFLVTVLREGSDLDPVAISDRLSLAAEVPPRGK